MRKNNTGKLLIAAVVLIIAAAAAYMLLALPAIQAKEEGLRAEIKVQEKALAEITEASGNEQVLASDISSMKERIDARGKTLSADPKKVEQDITGILASLNIQSPTVTLGADEQLSPPGSYVPEIRTADINIRFTCDRLGGETAMQLMEAIPDAKLVITAFIFEEGDGQVLTGSWIVNAKLYYFNG
jgi:seryl-tRNA synthetase